jgi:hypothetical protein
MAEYAEQRGDYGFDVSAYSAISAYSAFYRALGESTFQKRHTQFLSSFHV